MSKRFGSSPPPERPDAKRLDSRVRLEEKIKEATDTIKILSQPVISGDSDFSLAKLLWLIVTSAPSEVGMKPREEFSVYEKMVRSDTELRKALIEAARQGNYEDVMYLPILQKPKAELYPFLVKPSRTNEIVLSVFVLSYGWINGPMSVLGDSSYQAFQAPYVPGFPEALLKALDTYKGQTSYNKAIPIIQSSGMGKSRGIEEVARRRFTFLFNIVQNVSHRGFPHPDQNVGSFFLAALKLPSDGAVQQNYAAFLCSLFTHAKKSLEDYSIDLAVPLPLWWVIADVKSILLEHGDNVYTQLESLCQDFVQSLAQYKQPGVRCILAFDEAQELAQRPGADGGLTRTLYHNFGSVLKNIGSLAPPAYIHPFTRDLARAPDFLPPFTEFPFDVFAANLYQELRNANNSTLSATSSIGVMSRFGRVMWESLRKQGHTSIIELAITKLNPTHKFSMDKAAQLAALGIRISLDFDAARQTSRDMEEQLVGSHMRVVFAVPEHREFMRSGTPSEPILAEAAARLLNEGSGFETLAPAILTEAFENDFLARGERGGLVARLLWILAHDKALRDGQQTDMQSDDNTVRFHRPIPVIDFLLSLFHETHWDTVLNARPVGDENGLPLSDAFKDAHLHFSHFMEADDYNIVALRQVYRLLLRGAALNCKRNQESIDFLAPLLFGPPSTTEIRISSSSVMQAQVKNRNHSEDFLVSPTVSHGSENAHPVLSLVHELGTEMQAVKVKNESIRVTRSEHNVHARHYQIVAYGCSSKTYRVIPKTKNDAYTMLLGSKLLMQDFPRNDIEECLSMFQRMDPASELVHGVDNCRWFGRE